MKRIFSIILLGSTACMSSLAQGNFTFNNSNSSLVYDSGAVLEVAVMWSANLSAVPTTFLNGSPTPTSFSYAFWDGILTDPNFHLALSTAAGNPIIETTVGNSGPATGVYLGGIQYLIGSSVGQTIQLYVLGWHKAYGLDPVTAASFYSPVGFSAPIQYTLGSAILPGGGLGNAGISAFGVWPAPEPSTFTLAGLAAAALLITCRRRNHGRHWIQATEPTL